VEQELLQARPRVKHPFELMRQRRQDELDLDKRRQHLRRVRELDARIGQYNTSLKQPCHFALKL